MNSNDDLVISYHRQSAWRRWSEIFAAIPSPVSGKTILDLGCGIGDQAAELAKRGAHVVGIDSNREFVNAAIARRVPNAEFRDADLREMPDLGIDVDGIWSSFAAAYFPDLPPILTEWSRPLRVGGWMALTEIDDLFGHAPLSVASKSLLAAYAHQSFDAGRYDFHMGHKLRNQLAGSGFTVTQELILTDAELAFDGPASPDVITSWRERFERMTLLQEFCGSDFEKVRDEFLACLVRDDHVSRARVYCCIATK